VPLSARWARLLPGFWLGWLVCVAAVATPAPFAMLARADAGRVVGRILAQEAYSALLLGACLLILERAVAKRRLAAGAGSGFSLGVGLALGTLVCTVAGYFAVQPQMAAARVGQGSLSFGQLHAISSAFFALKIMLVAVMAWRASRPAERLAPAQAGGPPPESPLSPPASS